MSVYDKTGTSVDYLYDKTGASVTTAYDVDGNVVFNSGHTPDYDHYDNEYQHSILQARDAWAAAYREDDDIVPLVLTTDQHTYMNNNHGKPLHDYLSLAVNWTECSACLNLGDVCGSTYGASALTSMQSALSAIPTEKQINVAGNHDVQGLQDDSNALDTMFDTYFNNSAYNGYSCYGHRNCETMIDSDHHIRYIVLGNWDYQSGDSYYDYRRSTETIAWLINVMQTVDNNDIILLSHVPSDEGRGTMFEQYYPAVDAQPFRVKRASHMETSHYKVGIQELKYARKNKLSGTYEDVNGYTHSYDFTHCTSDFICSLHGHSHVDWYDYLSDSPSVTFDAYRYDDVPFFLINVDRNGEKIDAWKIGESGERQKYTVPFTEYVNPCTGITLDQHTLTIAVGQTALLTPTISAQYPDDGTYPQWIPSSWNVRVGSSLSSRVASVSNGLVTANEAGECTVYVFCGEYSDSCAVTVVDA